MELQLSKKIFATLMSAVLVLALVPVFACAQLQTAFADETPVPGPAIKNSSGGCVLPSNVTGRNLVEKITFTNEITQDPSITPEDVSESQDNSVKAWAVQLESGKYEVFYASDGKYPSFPANSAKFFYNMNKLQSISGIENVSTANVTDMSEMFVSCNSVTSLDLSSFDTSKVTTFSHMFDRCYKLEVLDLSSFDTANATDMSSMFYWCSGLKQLNLASFDTSNVTNMFEMFSNCYYMRQLDISSFNTSNVTNMSNMFSNLSSVRQLDLSSFDTSKVTDMSSMFEEAISLGQLNLSSFDTSNVTNMSKMFFECDSLTTLDLSSFDTSKVTDMYSMFNSCFGLESVNVSSFTGTSLDDAESMFEFCTSLTSIDLSKLNTPVLTEADSMFAFSKKLKSINLASFDAQSLTSCGAMFASCYNLESIYTTDKFTLPSNCVSDYLFFQTEKIEGENGTTYDYEKEDGAYARIDAGEAAPGYFKLAKVTSVKLSADSFTYSGKANTAKVVVKCGDFVLSEGTDYTVSYPTNAKKIGKYSLTVNGAGSYASSVKANFKIIPRSCKLKSVKASTKALKVKWKKSTKANASGYQIKIATNKKFSKGKKIVKVKSFKTKSKKISKLKKNKKYYVKVRAYKVVDGKTYYSAWSKVKTKKTK